MFGYLTGFDNDVFDQLERMRRQMDQLFGGPGTDPGIRAGTPGAYPPINVGSAGGEVDVYVFCAGVDRDSLDISMQQNLLTVAGARRTDVPEGAQAYRRERFDGEFRRVLSLPEDVDPDKVDASYRDGVLHIRVQRREESRPRQIEVK